MHACILTKAPASLQAPKWLLAASQCGGGGCYCACCWPHLAHGLAVRQPLKRLGLVLRHCTHARTQAAAHTRRACSACLPDATRASEARGRAHAHAGVQRCHADLHSRTRPCRAYAKAPSPLHSHARTRAAHARPVMPCPLLSPHPTPPPGAGWGESCMPACPHTRTCVVHVKANGLDALHRQRAVAEDLALERDARPRRQHLAAPQRRVAQARRRVAAVALQPTVRRCRRVCMQSARARARAARPPPDEPSGVQAG